MLVNVNRVITVKGVAGLGNRLFTLAYAMSLAGGKSHRVAVDWSDGQIGPQGADLFSEYFVCTRDLHGVTSEWRIHSVEGDYTLSKPLTSLFRPLLRTGLIDSAEVWSSKCRRPRFIFPLEVELLLRKDAPICATHLPGKEHANELNLIKIREDVAKRFDQLLPIDLESRIGVHVRYSDKRPDQDFQQLIQRVKNKKVLLATDSALVQKVFLEECTDCAVLSSILHDGLSKKGLHHQVFEHDKKLQVFEESLLDMYALSKSGTFLGQFNSSFSRVVGTWREGQGVQFWS